MSKRYTYEEVKVFIESEDGNGCKLISTELINTSTKLDLECACSNPFKASFSKFIYQNKRQCNECGNKNKIQKQMKSNNQFLNELEDMFGNEIIPLENYKGAREHILFKHILCGHEWYSTPDNLLSGKGSICPKCTRIITTAEFKEIVKNKFGENYEVRGKYIDSKTSLLMFHKTCNNEFEATPDLILNNLPSLLKDECPKCSMNHLKTTEEFKKEVYDLVGDEYVIVGKYNGARNNTTMRHNTCGNVYEVTPDSFLNKMAKCACVSISKGEFYILNYLIQNDLNNISQIKFKECKDKEKLPFDFGIFDENYNLKFLIEYDGEHHFFPVDFAGRGEEWADKEFIKIQKHDQIKNQYCKDNEIKLIRIPYWEFNRLEEILNNYLIEPIDNFNGSFF